MTSGLAAAGTGRILSDAKRRRRRATGSCEGAPPATASRRAWSPGGRPRLTGVGPAVPGRRPSPPRRGPLPGCPAFRRPLGGAADPPPSRPAGSADYGRGRRGGRPTGRPRDPCRSCPGPSARPPPCPLVARGEQPVLPARSHRRQRPPAGPVVDLQGPGLPRPYRGVPTVRCATGRFPDRALGEGLRTPPIPPGADRVRERPRPSRPQPVAGAVPRRVIPLGVMFPRPLASSSTS